MGVHPHRAVWSTIWRFYDLATEKASAFVCLALQKATFHIEPMVGT